MADKVTTLAVPHAGPAASHTTTSGSINANTILISFDDATACDTLMQLLEVAKCDILAYYARGKA